MPTGMTIVILRTASTNQPVVTSWNRPGRQRS